MLASEPECTRRLRNPLASSACPAAVQTDCRCGPNAAASEETRPARDPTSDIIIDSKPAKGLPRKATGCHITAALAGCCPCRERQTTRLNCFKSTGDSIEFAA